MNGNWLELREFVQAWIDDQLAAEPDLAARAVLTFHRNRIVDMVEASLLRQMGRTSDGQWLQ